MIVDLLQRCFDNAARGLARVRRAEIRADDANGYILSEDSGAHFFSLPHSARPVAFEYQSSLSSV